MIRPSRGWNFVKLALLTVGMTAACGAVVFIADSWFHIAIGAIGVIFFGGGGGFALWSMSRTPWTIAFAPDALEIRREDHITRAPWDDIETVGMVKMHGQKMPSIRLSSYDRYLASHSPETARAYGRRIGAMKWIAGATAIATARPALAGHAVADKIEGYLGANRAMTGYDISFAWSQLDRPAKKFVALLESEWLARRST